MGLFFCLQFDKIEALKGCIKEVIINGKKEDLVGDRAKHHHVGQCFPNIEKGVYFPGDSYAIAGTLNNTIRFVIIISYQILRNFFLPANNFSIGTSLQLELEFRTTEMNGVLMLLSEPDGYPSISLELNKGKVCLIKITYNLLSNFVRLLILNRSLCLFRSF